jgi:hypothetical protein
VVVPIPVWANALKEIKKNNKTFFISLLQIYRTQYHMIPGF